MQMTKNPPKETAANATLVEHPTGSTGNLRPTKAAHAQAAEVTGVKDKSTCDDDEETSFPERKATEAIPTAEEARAADSANQAEGRKELKYTRYEGLALFL